MDKPRKQSLIPLLAFCAIVLLLLLLALFAYTTLRDERRTAAEIALKAVGELKIVEIKNWLAERQGDINIQANDSVIAIQFDRWLKSGGADTAAYATIVARFATLQQSYGYENIAVFDRAGILRISSSTGEALAEHQDDALAAMRADKPQLIDFHKHQGEPVRVGMMAPLKVSTANNGRAIGAIFLLTAAASKLFPALQKWPLASHSGETVLARREGEQILFIATVRAAPLELRLPMSSPDLPSSRVLRGEIGILNHARDYHGVPVLAYGDRVPDTPWILITKEDQSEVDEPMERGARWLIALTLLLATVAGVAMRFWWTARESGYRAQMLVKYQDELEATVAQRTQALETANKDLENFSYSVSHDLRSPLRAIDGFITILLDEYATQLDADGQRIFGIVANNARKMGELIDDILEFSRASRLELDPVPVDMTALAREVWTSLTELDEGREIDFQLAPLPDVQCDPRALRQVWQNLFTNALKFSRDRHPAIIRVSATDEGAFVRYAVTDNGAGFSQEYASKLFVLFQRLHGMDEFEGTGVGLAIIKRFIQKHGGEVTAAGVPNAGATFTFTLPKQPNPTSA